MHGLQLELVEREAGSQNTWSSDGLSPEVAIKGFAGAVLYSTNPKATIETLTETMGLSQLTEEDNVARLTTEGSSGHTTMSH
ncbi:MAG: hypothetical protein LRY37_01560 [Alkalibacterium thalassium]|nr:hypothetical protein [Alkalibacterium thalassium]